MVRQSEDTILEGLRQLVQKWGAVLAVSGSAVALFYQHKHQVEQLSEAVVRLRADCDARELRAVTIRGFGPDGFTDPQIDAALDNHIRAFLRGYATQAERDLRIWRARFCELNPTIHCPGE